MNTARHEKLGIKQTIQISWMDRVVQMMLAGITEKDIRKDLDGFLSSQKQSGGVGERGQKSYGMAIGILASWFSPDPDLVQFRDEVLQVASTIPPRDWLPLHWAVLSASYPFWFNVARQVGRLLNLQEQITQPQVFGRLKEQFGDRETVARNARYTIRSFVAWDILKDSESRGSYVKTRPHIIEDHQVAILLLEAALHANVEAKGELSLLVNNPAFFPFQFPTINGDIMAQRSSRIEVVRYGLDAELLKLQFPPG